MENQNEKAQTAEYEVVSPLRRNGKLYKVGEPIRLTEEEAEELKGVVSEPGAAPGTKGDVAGVTQQQVAELQERLKGDLAAVKAEREAADKALDDAKAERAEAENLLADAQKAGDEAFQDLEAAKAERAEAEKARDETKKLAEQADKDRKAVEKAAKK